MNTGDKLKKEDLTKGIKIFGTFLITIFALIGAAFILWWILMLIATGTGIVFMFLGEIPVKFLHSLIVFFVFGLSIHQIHDMIKTTRQNPKMSYFGKLFRSLKWLWVKDYEIDFDKEIEEDKIYGK